MTAHVEISEHAEELDLGGLHDTLGFLVRLAQVQMFQSFYQDMSDIGLKLGEYTALRVIGLNPGARQGTVARALKIKPAHMTKLVQRLVNADLVERRVPPGDRRSITLSLTKAGEQFVERHTAKTREFDTRKPSGLSNAEFEKLLMLLQKLVGQGKA